MANLWRTVRVFISSTFSDMHSERDYLVKVVFPALRERLLKHRIRLIDVDLRWGVTEEQSSNDQVLDLCLEQINSCRPFFVGMLGERYGSKPHKISEVVRTKYDWLWQFSEKSVTELEILYGVLLSDEMQARSLFYFRDPAFIGDVPYEKRADVESVNADDRRNLDDLKQSIRKANLPNPPFENYPCRYRGLRINWRLLKNDFTPEVTAALEEVAADGVVESAEYDSLDKELRDIVSQYGTIYLDQLELFGQQVELQLWQAISKQFGLSDSLDGDAGDNAESEDLWHELWLESQLHFYVPLKKLERMLLLAACATDGIPILLTGPSGSGKSTQLARLVSTLRQRQPDTLVIPHFVGASRSSADIVSMLNRLCQTLAEVLRIERIDTHKFDELVLEFARLLRRIPANRRLVIIIDAIDQLDDNEDARGLFWLPKETPPNVAIIASCLSRDYYQLPVLEAFSWRLYASCETTPLSDEERQSIVSTVPSISAKTLSGDQIQLLLDNGATKSPLFLFVALEELRGFGSFEQLSQRIRHFPHGPNANEAIFEQVIERLESEFNLYLVTDLLSMLVTSRHGLSEAELSQIFVTKQCDLFTVLRQLRPYLVQRGSLISFGHRCLVSATETRYLTAEETKLSYHLRLAEFFTACDDEPRQVAELPWQLLQAKEWERLYCLLTDREFIGKLTWNDSDGLAGYWRQIEEATDFRAAAGYMAVLENHNEQDETCLFSLSKLFYELQNFPQATRIQDILIEHCRRVISGEDEFRNVTFVARNADEQN